MTQASNNISTGLKDKLKYEWKHIYRKVNANDVDELGTVTLTDFTKALDQTNTFLSREDMKTIKT